MLISFDMDIQLVYWICNIPAEIIRIIAVISMAWYLATKGEHTVLYKLYKNMYIKTANSVESYCNGHIFSPCCSNSILWTTYAMQPCNKWRLHLSSSPTLTFCQCMVFMSTWRKQHPWWTSALRRRLVCMRQFTVVNDTFLGVFFVSRLWCLHLRPSAIGWSFLSLCSGRAGFRPSATGS